MDSNDFRIVMCDRHGIVERRSLSIGEALLNPGPNLAGFQYACFGRFLSLRIPRNEDA